MRRGGSAIRGAAGSGKNVIKCCLKVGEEGHSKGIPKNGAEGEM